MLLGTLVVVSVCCIVQCDGALTVVEPYAMKGTMVTALANFGSPPLTTRLIRGPLVLADPLDGCAAVASGQYRGSIVLAKRGGCSFASKAIVAQGGDALGIVVANIIPSSNSPPDSETPGELFTMADDGQGHRVRIHAEMIGPEDAQVLIRAIESYREEVVVSLGHIVATPLFMS